MLLLFCSVSAEPPDVQVLRVSSFYTTPDDTLSPDAQIPHWESFDQMPAEVQSIRMYANASRPQNPGQMEPYAWIHQKIPWIFH